jgi:hypothetical protein
MQDLIPKYKRMFGIECPLEEFSPIELKRRWRILCKKYHPDIGGMEEHFRFVQEGYAELKKHCKGKEKKNTSSFTSEVPHGIGEIKVKMSGGGYAYLWDVGEANFKKRYEWEKTHGVNLNKYY